MLEESTPFLRGEKSDSLVESTPYELNREYKLTCRAITSVLLISFCYCLGYTVSCNLNETIFGNYFFLKLRKL